MFLAILLAAAVTNDTVYVNVGNWTIFHDMEGKVCRAIAAYQGGEIVSVEYDAAKKSSTLIFTEKDATSLKTGDKRKIDVSLLVNGKLDDGWEDTEFTVFVDETGHRMLLSQALDGPFLQDFAKASAIGFFYGTTNIGSYTLTGTAKATAELRTCAMKVAGINPRDPFAQ